MKRVFLIFLLLFASTGFAQDVDSMIELLRSDVRTEKVAVVTEVMEFTEEEAAVFWPVFRTYQFELEQLGDAYVGIIKDFADNYDALTDEKAAELTEKAFKYKEDRLKLQKKYFKEFSKLLSPIRAARWAQVENQIGLLIEVQVVAEIPLAEQPLDD